MPKNNFIEDEDLNLFRSSLLSAILFTVALFSFFIATLSQFAIFPLDKLYMQVLYVYSFVSFLAFFLLKKEEENYFTALNLSLFSSLVTFTVMSLILVEDEFRFVWFFLISFASFILGGKRYGFVMTMLIGLIVVALYIYAPIKLSFYALLTFFSALFIFNIFAYYFLKKIENDSNLLQKRVKEEVAKQQEQEQMLLQKYRMANMGEMIDAIAHQWRQPLMQSNMILLNMYDSLDDGEYNELYLKEKIEEIATLTAHMSQTIDDFRSLLTDGKTKTTFVVNDVVDEVLRVLKNSLKDIDVQWTSKNRVELNAYKNELMQVLITLILNAVEALEKQESKMIFITVMSDSEFMILSVEDNAGGVPIEIQKKIFDPYFTTKEQLGGTGLGLYISKIIIEKNMQGVLNMTNTKEGAKFSINIKQKK